MQDLKVLLVQNDTVWHNPEVNCQQIETLIKTSTQNFDLIVLPEMFNTGFTMESSELSQLMNGKTHQWMKALASELGVAICGSVIINQEGKYFNRFIWVDEAGNTITYDKRHLFRMANEHDHYSSGNQNVVIHYKNWRIRPQVCYDLRFPVWARNRLIANKYEYDILINVANWPEARVSAWDSLLKARAIENHAYAIGVNRVGQDGKGINYSGHSAVYDPRGNDLIHLDNKVIVECVSLSYADLDHYRTQFPAQLDADDFALLN